MKQDGPLISEPKSPPESTRFLLIKAKGGLGNRILSAVTGLVYADLTGRVPVIDWRDGAYADAGVNTYPLLFQSPLDLHPESLEQLEDVVPHIWRGNLHEQPTTMIARNNPKSHSNPFIYRKYCVDLSRPNTANMLAVYWSYLPKLRRLRKLMAQNPYFSGRREDEIFKEYLDRYFTPNERVLSAVKSLLATRTRPIIGVHVRYTDLTVPLSEVHKAIRKSLKELPDASIFLATDNDRIQEEIQQSYSRVFSLEKWFAPDGQAIHHNMAAPNMLEEAENALIDMWMLSHCDRLIFSMRSTFSYASRLIGRMPAKSSIDIDSRNIQVVLKRFVQNYI